MKIENTALRLNKIMSLRNLRQVDILEAAQPYCKKYGVKLNKSDLSQYVSGIVEPGSYKLKILSLALNVSETWLMGFDVPMQDDINNPPQFSTSRLQSFEGSDPEVKQIDLTKLDHIDELVSAAGKLSIEQINLLTTMAKNMKDKA